MHDAAYYIDLLLSGVTVGSLYALIAIGYTMVYGILRLINFAHGDIFMMAGFFMVYAATWMPMAVCIPLVLIATVALGVLIEKAAYSPLRTAPRMSVMISAIGVSYLLQNLATYITGGIARAYPDIPFLTQVMQVGSLNVKRITIITPILTILLVVVLVILIQKTKIGMAMRAVSRDFETAQLMGIKINSVISVNSVLLQLWSGQPHDRRYAWPESLCSGGVRRYRLDPRCGDRCVYHRYLRVAYQVQRRYGRVQQCLYVCTVDRDPAVQAQRLVRRKTDGEGVRYEEQ